MVEDGTRPKGDLGGHIGQIGLFCQGDVALHQHRPALRLEHDQAPWVVGARPWRGGHEQEMDRLLEADPGRHVQERAIRPEGRVERAEGVTGLSGGGLRGGGLRGDGEVGTHRRLVGDQGLREVAETAARRQRPDRRKLGHVPPVDEHEATPRGRPHREARQIFLGRHLPPRVGGQVERRRHQQREARVLPLLVAGGGQATLGEAPDRGPARLAQPGRPVEGASPLALAVSREEGFLGGPVRHRGSASADASSHSYPRASSSWARVLSPDFTMRPPVSTCTRSGVTYSSSRW